MIGEAQRVRPSARGHLYFELIEKGDRDEIIGKLDAVIWKGDLLRVRKMLAPSGQQIAEGMQIRCRASVDFYGPGGRLQLCVREVDPTFTLGMLELRRRETLAALAAAGLLERNQALPLPDLPLRIALITSRESAAYHDFSPASPRAASDLKVLLLHAAMQGRDAEREVVSALAAISRLPVDCAVLIRGGGSRSDLAVFDSRAIAEAIARAPFPVLAGLGHEIDVSIADQVAHQSFKTPTKVAEFLVERLVRQEQRLDDLRRTLVREALEPLRAGREALGRAERGVQLRPPAARLRRSAHRRAGARPRPPGPQRSAPGGTPSSGGAEPPCRPRAAPCRSRRERARAPGRKMIAAARGHLRETRATLQGMERLCQQLDPERTLERGFSLTRGPQGDLLRHPDQVRAGDHITTRVSGGTLDSRVETS